VFFLFAFDILSNGVHEDGLVWFVMHRYGWKTHRHRYGLHCMARDIVFIRR
jgi:hypothetical protein